MSDVKKVIFSVNISKGMLTWSEIPGKIRQPAAFLQGKGQEIQGHQAAECTTTTWWRAPLYKYRINPQKRDSKQGQ